MARPASPGAVLCGLAAYAYPRDPEFNLSLAGKWLGFVGVLFVLVGAETLIFQWCGRALHGDLFSRRREQQP